MADEIFENPRLAAIYDSLDEDRSDLLAYLTIVQELGAHHVLDLGCGTGTFALLMAGRGCVVTGVDPAQASLDVARGKTDADRVTWIHGDARDLPPSHVDLVTMTGNVSQAIVDPADWDATLHGAFEALRPGGYLVFETREPAFQGWTEWNRESSYRFKVIDGIGPVENWVDLTDLTWPLVSFRTTWVFHSDDAILTSDSTLCFRGRAEIETALHAHGFAVTEVRSAPDRPDRELVFLAQALTPAPHNAGTERP